MDWQPIETAPNNGNAREDLILLAVDDKVTTLHFDPLSTTPTQFLPAPPKDVA